MFSHPPFWLALLLPASIACAAWAARWLTAGGAIAATVVGLLVFWLGGGEAVIPLVAFFVSSSLLSVIGRRRTTQDDMGSKRTAAQVTANGAAAAALVTAHRLLAYHLPLETNRIVQILFLTAIATVNSDTWSTEIGTRWGGQPRLLTNWRKAAPGTSGAVSAFGTLAAAGGALFIPVCTMRLWGMTNAEFVAVAWAAFLGCLFDSILGAGIQAQYRNIVTNLVTDRAEGDSTVQTRGLKWIDNNIVNFASSLAGPFFCWVLLHYGLRNVW